MSPPPPCGRVRSTAACTSPGAGNRRPSLATVYVRQDRELDLNTVVKFRDGLDAGMSLGGDEVVFDMRGIEFFGSAGASILVEVLALSADDGLAVAVRPSPTVARVFQATGLDQMVRLMWD